MRTSSRYFVASLLLGLVAASSVNGGSLVVNSTADDGTGTCTTSKCTLRDAVLSAGSGQTITFSLPANSTITLTNGQLVIDKNLTIIGPGANTFAIRRNSDSGTPIFRIFTVTGSVFAISGAIIANGNGGEAGGGAILNNGGTVSISNCYLTSNVNSPSASGSGGGIVNKGTMTISNSVIYSNGVGTAGSGGGIANVSGLLTIDNSTIAGNSGTSGGGGLSCDSGSTVTITNSTIAENRSGSGLGGGLYIQGTLNLKSTIVAKNSAVQGQDVSGTVTSQGFNLFGSTSNTTISGTTTGNQLNVDPKLDTIKYNGGQTPTYALLPGSPAINGGSSNGATTDQRGFTRPVYDPNHTYVGDGSDIGAFEVQANDLPVCSEINLVVNNNNDSGAGSLRSVVLSACVGSTISFAPSVRGSINLASELLIDKSLAISGPGANLLTIQRTAGNNSPFFSVFDVSKANTNVALSGFTVSGGVSTNSGGGIYSAANLKLTKMAVSGNRAIAGGGIFNDFGSLTIDASTISGNTVSGLISGSGGGIFTKGGKLSITNSTISGNSAIANNSSHDDSAGGVFSNLSTVTITSTTITGNSGDLGGGFRSPNGGTSTVTNSIIDLNTSPNGPDVNGPMTSGGFNIIGSTTQGLSPFQFSDQNGVTAAQLHLGPLQDNGGPTFTHALLPGSVAIDKGDYSGLFVDQRGLTRPVDQPDVANYSFGGDGADIGAYEVQLPCTFSITPTGQAFAAAGGDNTITVTSTSGCAWTAQSNDSFITITGGSSGNGNGTVSYSVSANSAATSRSGTLTVAGQTFAITQDAAAQPTPTATPTPTPPSQLENLSTRKQVGTAGNVLIGGFIVVGTEDKKVLLRGLGPSLPVDGALADPTLELHGSDTSLLGFNDNWRDASNADQIAAILPPPNDLESAILTTLSAKPAGDGGAGYTGVLAGKGGTTGIGLLEIYDLDTAANSKLANISTRGFVGTGDDLLIGGFIPGPSDHAAIKVLVRALGPSLTAQGVNGALADPVLELHDTNGTLITNDNWKDASNAAEIEATLPPSDDRESAIITTLVPSNAGYTAVVRGANGTTGVALVEVYALP